MISTKGRYALRVMIDLAENGDFDDAGNSKEPGASGNNGGKPAADEHKGGYIALKDIAERQDISKKYLEIIVKDLVAAGLVKGTRGKSGGYKLCRKPEEYNVGEILDATEGSMACVACLAKDAAECPRSSFCKTLPMWAEYDEMTHDFFYNRKLSDLCGQNTKRV